VANFTAAFRRAFARAPASETITNKQSSAARDAEREGPRRCPLPVVRSADFAGRAGLTPPVRPGKAFCATSMRMSAGNSVSLTSLDRH
jgi:hypothetical protein